VHVSCLKESRNALSYRPLTFHMICLLYSLFLLVDEKVIIHRPRFTRVSVSETENAEVLNGAFSDPERSRASQAMTFQDRSFPSLNLSRSYNQLATAWRRVEILYASSGDRICLFRGNQKAEGKRN
jgi:hypothetical protein